VDSRLDPPGRAERERLLAILRLPPEAAAPRLLGQRLVRRLGRKTLTVRIVETEAYLGASDPAAHVYRGRRTRRTAPLFDKPGTLYVYIVYGMHHCLNLSVDAEGEPGCVLIRAAEPLDAALAPRALSGPGRLCRALALDTRHSGRHVFEANPPLTLREGRAPARVAVSPRIGIRRAAQRPLRFYDALSPAVSALARS
jgi:DNA-3-methyladenine glycosylase